MKRVAAIDGGLDVLEVNVQASDAEDEAIQGLDAEQGDAEERERVDEGGDAVSSEIEPRNVGGVEETSDFGGAREAVPAVGVGGDFGGEGEEGGGEEALDYSEQQLALAQLLAGDGVGAGEAAAQGGGEAGDAAGGAVGAEEEDPADLLGALEAEAGLLHRLEGGVGAVDLHHREGGALHLHYHRRPPRLLPSPPFPNSGHFFFLFNFFQKKKRKKFQRIKNLTAAMKEESRSFRP